ncbi:MAG: S1C family serine protease [Candidatus Neomarinimicrobiota bacterium]|jgi:S1-C subfamily serine protease
MVKKILIFILVFNFCNTEVTDSTITTETSLTETSLESTTTSTTIFENELDTLLVDTIEEAQNAVVRIVTQGEYIFPDDNFDINSEMVPGSGSGFIISNDGYIVTNNHVVAGSSTIEVFFNNTDKSIPAQLIAKSECLDLALLKIRGNEYNYFEFNTEETVIGTEIRAAGYPLGDKQFTLTDGIVSKVSADSVQTWAYVQESFEHTAIINPGSSGGPIFNDNFKILGVSYAGNSLNQYFAIKSKLVESEINFLKETKESIGLGINFQLIDGVGLYLYSTDSGKVFDNIGIQGGDIITNFAGFDMTQEIDMKNFCNVLTTQSSTGSIKLEGYRFANDSYFVGQTNSNNSIEFESTTVAAAPTTSTPTTTAYRYLYSQRTIDAWYKVVSMDSKWTDWGRWNKSNVKVGIIGNPSILQADTMKYMIGDLNRIVSRINWSYGNVTVDNISDFDIYLIFEDNSEWQLWADVWETTVEPYYSDGSKKYYDEIRFWGGSDNSWGENIGFINPKNSDNENCQIYSIRGIMLSLIGLGDLYTDEFGNNVMLGTLCTHVLTELDEEIIKLHYDTRLTNNRDLSIAKSSALKLSK